MIVWVTKLPSDDEINVTEVQLTGVITGAGSTDNPEEAVGEES